jgi:RNA polymerase sigma factor for flagellar operon FliA
MPEMTTKRDQVRRKLKSAYTQSGKSASKPRQDRASQKELEQVIRDHSDLVNRIARRCARSLGGAIDVDDLTSVGTMGLIQAYNKYEPMEGKSFRSYAEFRVRGAILDEMRRIDPMSQPMRRKVRKFENSVNMLAHTLGRLPNEDELAEHLDVSLEEIHEMRRDLQQVRFIYSDDRDLDNLHDRIAKSKLDRQALRVVLVNALGLLEERDQQIIALYYFHDLRLREIGEVLDLTEARVCQLHKRAVDRLRVVLDEAETIA